ncbi:hypothetical protein GLAREA_07391 [Glarea lozoyensis ATCC 20868]|uniref:Uncharacterized protein n=1 Tax=Glarea lozoyensis (strain ATCC 20868 / MF5171) TaxID=1116229 RepID=S3E182_GLAL2|nr:uncharacterized protein GLAREA_07391 [Glarea lozoyensis ATCC 20868]EPE32258.1 hypothetical protein GLAREA_07391 [Glarea lozoyensis ATCC 20868]
MGFCAACDLKVENDLPLSLSEFCDCDQYRRWICFPCKVKENCVEAKYIETRTKEVSRAASQEALAEIYEGLWQRAAYDVTGYWCPCGERVPQDGNIRCMWCKRRHNLNTWKNGDRDAIPFFDDDPCYPQMIFDPAGGLWDENMTYAPLAYDGPIY